MPKSGQLNRLWSPIRHKFRPANPFCQVITSCNQHDHIWSKVIEGRPRRARTISATSLRPAATCKTSWAPRAVWPRTWVPVSNHMLARLKLARDNFKKMLISHQIQDRTRELSRARAAYTCRGTSSRWVKACLPIAWIRRAAATTTISQVCTLARILQIWYQLRLRIATVFKNKSKALRGINLKPTTLRDMTYRFYRIRRRAARILTIIKRLYMIQRNSKTIRIIN